MLWAIDELASKGLPFYGINLGNKGFLLNDKDYLSEEFIEKKYPLLEWILEYKWQKKSLFACNEFDIRTENGRIISLEIALESGLTLDVYWDGIVISTPLWSTWYNASLGWPILPHSCDLWIMSVKAPLQPKKLSPLLYSLSEKIYIKKIDHNWPIGIYRDGREVFNIEKSQDFSLTIGKKMEGVTLLVSRKYEKVWEEKIYKEQGFIR